MAFNALALSSQALGKVTHHTYSTDDDIAAVETANYFDDGAWSFQKGDVIHAVMENDTATPDLKDYVVLTSVRNDGNIGGTVTIAAQNVA